ncbi:hypothetical protein ACSBR2_035636 [Camellia fascicularis]
MKRTENPPYPPAGSRQRPYRDHQGVLLAVPSEETLTWELVPTSQGKLRLSQDLHSGRALNPHQVLIRQLEVQPPNQLYANNGRWVETEIYSSQTSSWKHIYVLDLRGVRFMFSAFWNGAIHCVTYANVHARFEVEEEKLIQTPMPRNPKTLSHDKIRYFGECGGDLLLIQTTQPYVMGFSILQMHRDYCGWIVKYRVNLRPILSVLPKTTHKTIITRCEFNVLCVVKGANEKDFTLVLAIWGKVISYNVKSKTLKELHDLSTDDLDDLGGASWCNTYQFIESLSPV